MTVETYRSSTPLVRKTDLTSKANGGIGKELSDGYGINFAVGCVGCPFCYVPEIHDRFHRKRMGLEGEWGEYLLVREDMDKLIERTNWDRFKDVEILMSSTHDPYHPELAGYTKAILEQALPRGVRFRIQTRQIPSRADLQLMWEHRPQVRFQMSIATHFESLSNLIEPKVPTPDERLKLLREVADWGIPTGVIIAPIMPPNPHSAGPVPDLRYLAFFLSYYQVDRIYGEALHLRGKNLESLNQVLGTTWTGVDLKAWDAKADVYFHRALSEQGLFGVYWKEHR